MEFKKGAQKGFNKIKLRKIKVLDQTFLWKTGHLHLEKFEHSQCVEKVIIYLENYKNSPLALYFRQEDNRLIKLLSENEKWLVGYPDKGVIWKSTTGKPVPQGENKYTVQINLNNPSVIERIIKYYYKNKWNPGESSNSSFVEEHALTILDETDLFKTRIDNLLLNNIREISEQLNKKNYSELFEKGHRIIVEFKDNKGNKDVAYNTIHELHLKYMDTDEGKMDLVDDWLDCISGYYVGQNILWG